MILKLFSNLNDFMIKVVNSGMVTAFTAHNCGMDVSSVEYLICKHMGRQGVYFTSKGITD